MQETHKYREFSSYSGLDRVALIFGMPLLPAIGILTLSMFTMLACAAMFGIVGFLFALLFVPFVFLLRTICANDDRALEIMALELRYKFKRRGYNEFGKTLTYLPERYFRHQKINEHNTLFDSEDAYVIQKRSQK